MDLKFRDLLLLLIQLYLHFRFPILVLIFGHIEYRRCDIIDNLVYFVAGLLFAGLDRLTHISLPGLLF